MGHIRPPLWLCETTQDSKPHQCFRVINHAIFSVLLFSKSFGARYIIRARSCPATVQNGVYSTGLKDYAMVWCVTVNPMIILQEFFFSTPTNFQLHFLITSWSGWERSVKYHQRQIKVHRGLEESYKKDIGWCRTFTMYVITYPCWV